MKRSKFSEAQVAMILRQADEGATIGEVCRRAGISEATFYVWRKKYAGLMPSEMKRLKQLEDENGRLINENRHLLKVEVLITGSGRPAQEIALLLLNPMLELHKPTWTIFRV